MTKTSGNFKFSVPDNWSHFQDQDRLIFQGPDHEELIISASEVAGYGQPNARQSVQEHLFENALQSITNAAKNPALKITRELHRDSRATNIECWSLLAETHDGRVLFYESVFRGQRGILLSTFEAINTTASDVMFEEFLKSVQGVAKDEALVE